MIVGSRDETIEEKRIRHMREAREQIEGWSKEMLFAKEKSDSSYEKYCELMIQILKNTIKNIEEFISY